MSRWERRPAPWGVLLAACLLALPAWAQPGGALQRGERLVGFCANCHGANGNSSAPEIPNLAGQNADYLHEQMRRFVDGRRKDLFMAGLIKAMSEAERSDAVAYLSEQTVTPRPVSASAAQLAEGKAYYGKVCFRCHGDTALGQGTVPRLAGQQAGYLLKSLRRYRDGTGERLEPTMAANTRLMTDAQLQAVSLYLASLR